jgi:hypothetical protein
MARVRTPTLIAPGGATRAIPKALLRIPEVDRDLQIQPQARSGAEGTREQDRGLGRHCASTRDDPVGQGISRSDDFERELDAESSAAGSAPRSLR